MIVNLADWFWLRSFSGKCSSHLKACLRLEDVLSGLLNHMGVGRRLVFCPMGLSIDSSSILTAWELASLRMSDPRKRARQKQMRREIHTDKDTQKAGRNQLIEKHCVGRDQNQCHQHGDKLTCVS